MEELCKEWLKKTRWGEAKNALRYILYRGLDSDGTIKMTAGFSSDLTIEFTNILNSLEVFKRNGLLTPLELDLCLDKFAKQMDNKELAATHFYSVSEMNRKVATKPERINGSNRSM